MAFRLPSFRSTFLGQFCDALSSRSKALSYSGTLSYVADPTDPWEWLTITYVPLIGPYIIVQLGEDRGVSVFCRSRKRRNRGKVLLALREMVVVGSGFELVAVLERTIDHASAFHDGVLHNETVEVIHDEWRTIALSLTNQDGT